MIKKVRIEKRRRGVFGWLFPVLFLATPAVAMTDMDAVQVASELGSVIGSEDACGLSYDQAAISTWIAENVPPDRMDFASQLQVQVMGQGYMLDQMSESAKTAHCAAITQTARHFGFVE